MAGLGKYQRAEVLSTLCDWNGVAAVEILLERYAELSYSHPTYIFKWYGYYFPIGEFYKV